MEQKLAAKQNEVDDVVYRMQRCVKLAEYRRKETNNVLYYFLNANPLTRYQRETEALKDVLASYQNNADNDIAHKISEYETTIADYEVQVSLHSPVRVSELFDFSRRFFVVNVMSHTFS